MRFKSRHLTEIHPHWKLSANPHSFGPSHSQTCRPAPQADAIVNAQCPSPPAHRWYQGQMHACAFGLRIPGTYRKRRNPMQEAHALVIASETESSHPKDFLGLSTRPRPPQKCCLSECFQHGFSCCSTTAVNLSSPRVSGLTLTSAWEAPIAPITTAVPLFSVISLGSTQDFVQRKGSFGEEWGREWTQCANTALQKRTLLLNPGIQPEF